MLYIIGTCGIKKIMNMNFDDINKIYKHMCVAVYPHIQSPWNVSTETILVDKYLSGFKDCDEYKLLCVPFLMKSEAFLKRYLKKCVVFYNTPDPADGLMLFIHQISPTLHVHSRFFCWVENNEVHDYTAAIVFYKDSDDALKFINGNFDIAREGNTEDRSDRSGFKFK